MRAGFGPPFLLHRLQNPRKEHPVKKLLLSTLAALAVTTVAARAEFDDKDPLNQTALILAYNACCKWVTTVFTDEELQAWGIIMAGKGVDIDSNKTRIVLRAATIQQVFKNNGSKRSTCQLVWSKFQEGMQQASGD